MNPYKDLPIYTEGVLEDYIGKRCVHALPPTS
jgi:myosin heavy subunit